MRNAVLITILTALLLAGSAPALDTLWNNLVSAWGSQTGDEGYGLDPDGNCRPAPAPDSGCILDPYGRPVCSQGS